MADEIETYLVLRLREILAKEKDAHDSQLEAKFFSLSSKFEELEKTLAGELHEGKKPNRETLYELNNRLVKWTRLSEKKNQQYFSLDRLFFIWKFGGYFKQIKGKLFSDPDDKAAAPRTEEKFAEAYRWSTRSANFEVRGLDARAMSLQRLLVPRGGDDNNKFRAIGVVGMRGIGKTTLCQVIFNKKEIIKHFVPRIWVCISKQPKGCGDDEDSRKETVIRMLRCLGVEEETIEFSDGKHGLAGLLFALRLELMGKKYLIVLDDVWDTDDKYKNFCSGLDQEDPEEDCQKKKDDPEVKWTERLAYGLPKGCGGRVIVTSRSKEVAGKMVGEENLHSLERLSDDDCWDIFKYTIEKGDEKLSPELETLEWKIKEKCAGVPLAAKMMADIALDSIRSDRRPPPPGGPT